MAELIETYGKVGSTVFAQVYLGESKAISDIPLVPSSTVPSYFSATIPSNLPKNTYCLRILDNGILRKDTVVLNWDGTKEVTALTLYDQLVAIKTSTDRLTDSRLSKLDTDILEFTDIASIAASVRLALLTQLNTIQAASELASLPLLADDIDVDNAAVATYKVDGVTKLKQQTLDEFGNPIKGSIRRQIKVN